MERRRCQVGLLAYGVRGEIRTRNNAALNRTRLPGCATRTLVGSQGFEPWMFAARVTESTAQRFQPLSQLPKRELSKIWRKAGDSNAYVPQDPWCSKPVGYHLPEPSSKTTNNFKGNLQT